METFSENHSHPCSIDDFGWNRSITRKTMESIAMAYSSIQGSRESRKQHGSKHGVALAEHPVPRVKVIFM